MGFLTLKSDGNAPFELVNKLTRDDAPLTEVLPFKHVSENKVLKKKITTKGKTLCRGIEDPPKWNIPTHSGGSSIPRNWIFLRIGSPKSTSTREDVDDF